jgi:phenylalanyl-tRNA synthetase alpha chain
MSEEINLFQQLEQVQQEAKKALEKVLDENTLQAWKTAHLGRSAPVMQAFSHLGEVAKEMRPQFGKFANQVKVDLENAFNERSETIKQAALLHSLENERLDITLPGRRPVRGRLHPETQAMRDIFSIFSDMGFQVYRSPDVETDEYNFELLNIPAYHPARDMWDTFYATKPGVLLRTHTSPGQIHVMRENAPKPIRAILPGMCYRYEQISARSEIQFNQLELLVVGHNITFGDFKGTLNDFARRMFGENARTRLRPSYFPFTEPSAEMDVECFVCGGKGCSLCKGSGWLEIMGCGMVHPIVLQNGGYDPVEFTGFAAGMGIERMTLLRYHIDDIRYFWADDMRFLEQF